jgi:protein phosphatase 4 regulatory subunit 3
LKFFRQCLGLQDEFYYQQLTTHHVFAPILDIVSETCLRENLLNSACLELFDFVRREQIKPIIVHVVENYRPRLESLAELELFEFYLRRYEQMQQGYESSGMEPNLFGPDDETAAKVKLHLNGHGGRWQGMPDMDAQEEEYFNTSDDDDELAAASAAQKPLGSNMPNGSSPLMKPLVDYPEDDDDDDDPGGLGGADVRAFYHRIASQNDELLPDSEATATEPPAASAVRPPERLAEKRRREEDEDEDELGKLTATNKRRSSGGGSGGGKVLRRKQNFAASKEGGNSGSRGGGSSVGGGGKKIAISLGGAKGGEGDETK